MSLPVAILAGGLATRLRPITAKMPKALVPVAGKPFLARQLDLLHDQGIHAVTWNRRCIASGTALPWSRIFCFVWRFVSTD